MERQRCELYCPRAAERGADRATGRGPRPVRVSSVVRRRRAAGKTPDLAQIMAHLAKAIAFIRVSQRSLDHLDVVLEEESLLRRGLAALDAVDTEIDLAAIALSTPVRR